MPSTTPGSLASTSWSGDTDETTATNDPTNQGFPARTQGGDLVFIVRHEREHQLKVLIDADGNRYVDDQVLGFLVPYSSEEIGAQTEPQIEGHILLQDQPEVSGQNQEGTEAGEAADPALDPSADEAA